MALLKEISVRGSGVNATYWRLRGFEIDFISNIAVVHIAGYVSQELRDAGAGPIMNKQVRWVGSENPITAAHVMAGTAFQTAYAKLIAPETRPMMPPNPFEGAESI